MKLPSLKRLTLPLFAAAVVLVGLRVWPHAPLEKAVTSSRVVLADDGALLRMTLADDGQYRLWLPLERISPSLVEALLLKEDRNFYWHPGINPPALLRAAMATYSGGHGRAKQARHP